MGDGGAENDGWAARRDDGGDRLFGLDSSYYSDLFSIYMKADALNRPLLSWAALALLAVVLTIAAFLKRNDTEGMSSWKDERW